MDRSRQTVVPAVLRRAWPALVLGMLTVAVFWRVLFTSEGLSADASLLEWEPWSETGAMADQPRTNPLLRDQYAFFNPNEEFISRWVRRGVWPLWNPDLAHGIPTVASVQNAEYYPTNLVLWAVPPFWSRGIRAILRVVLCLLGTYGFGRAIGMGRSGATLAAMSFGFCGFNVVWLAHPPSNVSFVLPWILWTLERSLQTGAFTWRAGLALAAGAALLGGHPPTVLHITIMVVIWLAYRQFIRPADPVPRLPFRQSVRHLALAAIAAALIGSMAILPWTEYVAQNPIASRQVRNLRTLSWKTLAVWVIPDFFGTPMLGEWDWAGTVYGLPGWNNYAERTGYVGVTSLLLAGGMLLSRVAWGRGLPWLAGIAASVILIYDPPVLGAVARGLPVFAVINNSKMLCVAGFCMAILAGFGCDRLLDARRRFPWDLSRWAIVSVAAGVLIVALWPDASARDWMRHVGAGDAFVRDCLWALLPAVAVLGALGLVRASRRRPAIVLLLAVAMVDLWRFGSSFNPTIRPQHAAPPTGGIRYLQDDVGGARVLPVGPRLLPGNTMLRYGLADVRGGDWVNVRHYEFLLTGRTGHYDFGARLDRLPSTLAALNVSHVVFPRGTSLPAAIRPVYDAEMRIVAIVDPRPRAALVHDVRFVDGDEEARRLIASNQVDLRRTVLLPSAARTVVGTLSGSGSLEGERVTVRDSSPNEVRLSVEARRAGFVVLTDTFFPGWKSTLDGQPIRIMRANLAFRAVEVPAGTHEVVFRYRPWRALLGVALAGLTLLTIAAMALARMVLRPG